MKARRTHGLLVGFVALMAPLVIGTAALALTHPKLMALLQRPQLDARLISAALGLILPGLAAAGLLIVSLRLPPRTPGRFRAGLLGGAFVVCALALAAMFALATHLAAALPRGAPITLEDLALLAPRKSRVALIGLAALALAAAASALGAALSCWFLLSAKSRARTFWLLDALLLAATAWLSVQFPLQPTSGQDLLGPSARLIASIALGTRVGARLMPYLLDLIELVDFRSLVAARHLRAKKSGFLAAISFLSILAVSVSSCALTTTLSVMGGFRQDLKRKILGNNAHIVVDRPHGRIAEVDDLVTRIRRTPDVRGVSPYLSGEVMISSASNLAGAVLRGIDVAHVGEVSELPNNMRVGTLEYLSHPEKLIDLPPDSLSPLGRALGLPSGVRLETEPAAPEAARRLSEQLRQALGEAPEPEAVDDTANPSPVEAEPADDTSEPSSGERVLPGIVVGQELARSLRLYLGDEVNIVTPLGELGPTGPIPKSRPFRVAGVFYSGMYEYDMKFAYVTLASAQRFLGAGDSVSGVEITVREPEAADRVASRIRAQLDAPALRVRPWQELNKNLFGALALEKLAMFIALGIAILVASFCIIGTLTLMVQEKGREVAVLKAMGTPDRAIVSIFVLEGTLIGVFGSAIGLAFGYAACFAAEHFGIRLNPEVYYIDRLPVHVDLAEFLAVGVAAAVVSLLVTIYPAQLASRLRPVEALRYE